MSPFFSSQHIFVAELFVECFNELVNFERHKLGSGENLEVVFLATV